MSILPYLGLSAAGEILKKPERDRQAKFAAVQNKWAPYMNTSGLSAPAQPGLGSTLLDTYNLSLTDKGRSEANQILKNLLSDFGGGTDRAPAGDFGYGEKAGTDFTGIPQTPMATNRALPGDQTVDISTVLPFLGGK